MPCRRSSSGTSPPGTRPIPRRAATWWTSLWAADGSYTDPLADVRGPDAIAGLMGAAQQQFPGWVFTLGGPVDANHNQARFTWHLGPRRR